MWLRIVEVYLDLFGFVQNCSELFGSIQKYLDIFKSI